MKPSRSNEPERWTSRWALICEGRLAEALSAEERRWLLRELAVSRPRPRGQDGGVDTSTMPYAARNAATRSAGLDAYERG